MSDGPDITRQLRRELDETRLRLVEAEETLDAIRQGEADGFVIAGPQGPQVFTLQGALEPYRLLIEQMSEGALTLSRDGVILYANQTFAAMLQLPPGRVIGTALRDFLPAADQPAIAGLIATALNGSSSGEVSLRAAVGSTVTLRLGLHRLQLGAETLICAVATDITVEKQREIELRRLAERLEARVAERTADLAASRIAALNMMEDAVEGRKVVESANRGLTLEITARKQAEAEIRKDDVPRLARQRGVHRLGSVYALPRHVVAAGVQLTASIVLLLNREDVFAERTQRFEGRIKTPKPVHSGRADDACVVLRQSFFQAPGFKEQGHGVRRALKFATVRDTGSDKPGVPGPHRVFNPRAVTFPPTNGTARTREKQNNHRLPTLFVGPFRRPSHDAVDMHPLMVGSRIMAVPAAEEAGWQRDRPASVVRSRYELAVKIDHLLRIYATKSPGRSFFTDLPHHTVGSKNP